MLELLAKPKYIHLLKNEFIVQIYFVTFIILPKIILREDERLDDRANVQLAVDFSSFGPVYHFKVYIRVDHLSLLIIPLGVVNSKNVLKSFLFFKEKKIKNIQHLEGPFF